MEKFIQLPTPDRYEINGILNGKEESDKLIIFVHGFTGSMNEAHYYCAKEFFIEQGYDVFRFNLYTDGDKTRKLRNCTVKIHAQDIVTVLKHYSEYKEIYLVGHSLAGPCFVNVSKYPINVEKIIFWDPAFEMKSTGEKIYLDNSKYMYSSSGKHIEISSKMREEFLYDNFIGKLENHSFSTERMFIVYADGDRHVKHKSVTDGLGIESHVIVGVNHGFTQQGKYTELFEKTLEFINRMK